MNSSHIGWIIIRDDMVLYLLMGLLANFTCTLVAWSTAVNRMKSDQFLPGHVINHVGGHQTVMVCSSSQWGPVGKSTEDKLYKLDVIGK